MNDDERTPTPDHFPVTEFTCKGFVAPDGYHQPVPYPQEWEGDRLVELKALLEKIRLACGSHPVTVLCGFRTVEYNAELRRRGLQGERHATGVALHSQHTEGRAADICIFGTDTIVLLKTVLDQHEAGNLPELGGVGYYPILGFVHVDTFKLPDGTLRHWNG
jgi:uncharacterized protein YcbK (DUF882 family)